MVKRTELRSRADDRAFPVRVWLRGDTTGMDRYLWDEAEAWLNQQVGKGNWARHGSGWNMRLHMLTPEAAQRFVDKFPHFQLRDLTGQEDHLRRMRRPALPENKPPLEIDGAYGMQRPARPSREPPAELAPCSSMGNPPKDPERRNLQRLVDKIAGGGGGFIDMTKTTPPPPDVRLRQAGPVRAPSERLPFGRWLLLQEDRGGLIGQLARRAKADRQFPLEGDPEDVRRRLRAVGADGDMFVAVDEAELDWGCY